MNCIRSSTALLCVALLAGCGSISKLWDSVAGPSAESSASTAGASAAPANAAAVAAPVRPAPVPVPALQTPPAGAQAVTAVTTALNQGEARPLIGTGPGAAAPPRVLGGLVYFDFDSFEIRAEAQALIGSHAEVLRTERSRRVVVEGHADERGGREYNLSLGQKRADTVRQALIALGANDAQLEAVSFGEERPAVPGSDEAAWAQNRRAELKERR